MNGFAHASLAIIAGVVGLIFLIGFFASIIRVALLNRHREDLLALFVGRFVYRALYVRPWNANNERNHERRLWFLPLFIICLVATWVIAVLFAYAFFYWATGAEPNILQALISSGSSLSTLGFHTPHPNYAELLAISEGAIGLFILVFMLSFVPGYLGIIQSRDAQVGWLYARTKGKPSGSQILKWYYASGQAEELNRIWETWEDWFRNLGMVNDLYPELALVPPFAQGHSWVLASVAMLDASSLFCSVLDINGASADLCFLSGVRAMQFVEASALWPKTKEQRDMRSLALTRANFEAICLDLAHSGAPIKEDREKAWSDFLSRRTQYESLLLEIGRAVQTPGIVSPLGLEK